MGRIALIGLLVAAGSIAAVGVGTGTIGGRPASAARVGDAERITAQGLQADLDALAMIATANSGTRALGTAGYAASATYVETELRAAGWTVTSDEFDAPAFQDPGGSRLEVPAITGQSGGVFGRGEVAPLIYAPAGEVTARVIVLDWDPQETRPTGRGCLVADYPPESAGAIVAVRPGPCYRRDQVLAAQQAGAVGFVALNAAFGPGEVRRSTLIRPDGLRIPALAGTREVGNALAGVAASGSGAPGGSAPGGGPASRSRVTLVTRANTEIRPTRSVVAELAGTQPDRVVMLGAHLDSVLDGPGIDDDGSGVAALLGFARAAGAGARPQATLRLAFWAGEEVGLLGSGRYVTGLSADDRRALVAYLDADMLGSPNGFPGVYAEPDAAPGSAALTGRLQAALAAFRSPSVTVELGGGSDHAAFMRAGVPVGGLFSGALEPVTGEQSAASGSIGGRPADSCYHLACDGAANVDVTRATTMARALALVALQLADDPGQLDAR
jgi:Zn-dependent M28 family amino/carboxypeptidase